MQWLSYFRVFGVESGVLDAEGGVLGVENGVFDDPPTASTKKNATKTCALARRRALAEWRAL